MIFSEILMATGFAGATVVAALITARSVAADRRKAALESELSKIWVNVQNRPDFQLAMRKFERDATQAGKDVALALIDEMRQMREAQNRKFEAQDINELLSICEDRAVVTAMELIKQGGEEALACAR
jgi:hypothetical protein